MLSSYGCRLLTREEEPCHGEASDRICTYQRLMRWNPNPCMMPPPQAEALRAELKEYGFRDPLAVDQNYRVCGRHQRLDAAQALGLKQVPVVRTHVTEKHPQRKRCKS